MVRGSILSGGEVFRVRPDGLRGTPSLLYNGHRVFPVLKQSERGVDNPPPLFLYNHVPGRPLPFKKYL